MFFDTHAHYDNARFDVDRQHLLSQLPENNISLALNPGCNLPTSQKSIEYADSYPHMYAAVGFHPHYTIEMKAGDMETLRTLSKHPKVVAIGEIGLDYHYDFSPRQLQKECFQLQMTLAKEENLPTIVHSREATEDTLAMLRQFPGQIGVVHCFSGSLETAKIILDMGYYISFTGVLTFENAKKSREIVSYMPKDRLLLETDAPYMAPVPLRGKRSDSGQLVHIATVVAKLWDMPVEEVGAITTENGKQLFNIR